MSSKQLPTLKLSSLLETRHGLAVGALSLGLDKILPDGSPDDIRDKLVEFSLNELRAVGLASAADTIETASSYFSLAFLAHRLKQPVKLSLQFGDTTLVADTKQFNLVAILTKLQVLANNRRLRLVSPAVTLTDACYNYRWRGTIFSFSFGTLGETIRAEYVAWHPSPDFNAKAQLAFSIHRLQHRTGSDERGQS